MQTNGVRSLARFIKRESFNDVKVSCFYFFMRKYRIWLKTDFPSLSNSDQPKQQGLLALMSIRRTLTYEKVLRDSFHVTNGQNYRQNNFLIKIYANSLLLSLSSLMILFGRPKFLNLLRTVHVRKVIWIFEWFNLIYSLQCVNFNKWIAFRCSRSQSEWN